MVDVLSELYDDELQLGFFDRVKTHAFITRVAGQRKFTIFAGAGVSIDRNSPDWGSLVESLLSERLSDMDLARGTTPWAGYDNIAELLVARHEPLHAASAVRQLFQDRYTEAATTHLQNRLFGLLYANWEPRVSLASFIAKLALFLRSRGNDVHIVTANYDDNIETSSDYDPDLAGLASARGIRFSGSARPPRRIRSNSIPVVHIHGFMPRTGAVEGPFVFCEEDFFEWSDDTEGGPTAMQQYLTKRFTESCVLIVGSSVRDPNVVEALLATKTSGSMRVAVMPTQEEVDFASSLSTTVESRLFTIGTVLRLAHLGVETIRPDFFGQVSQLLNEIGICASDPSAYENVKYSTRLRQWSARWNEETLRNGIEATRANHNSTLRVMIAELQIEKVLPVNEGVKAELWIRCDPDSRKLELWSASHVVRTGDAGGTHLAAITHRSPYASVEAFVYRRATSGQITRPGDRWTHYVACPIILDDSRWLGLPVGVATLLIESERYASASDFPGSSEQLDVISKRLSSVGRQLLGPSRRRRSTADSS